MFWFRLIPEKKKQGISHLKENIYGGLFEAVHTLFDEISP